MKNLIAAFPKRPIQIHNEGILSIIRGLFIAILVFAAGIGIVIAVLYMPTPGIMKDLEISKDSEVIENATIRNGECKISKFIFKDCNFDIEYLGKNGWIKNHYNLYFFDFSSGDYSVAVIRSKSNPELISTDLAIDKLWNRIISAILFAALGILMVLGGIIMVIRGTRLRKNIKLMNSQTLNPVPVTITSHQMVNNTEMVSYTYNNNGAIKAFTTVIKKTEGGPFYASTREENTIALGIKASDYDYVLLLDENLQRIDMTDSERQALKHAREQDSIYG